MMDYSSQLNKAFESRVRLGVMSILMVNDWVEFSALKEMLDITDGNLASHITALEKAEYIQVKKQFVGKKPNTTYAATVSGRKAFNEHLNTLEKLLKAREDSTLPKKK
ncbi:MAG: winged helix-turn-helix domain-containing protein [Bacteroidia bacterium]